MILTVNWMLVFGLILFGLVCILLLVLWRYESALRKVYEDALKEQDILTRQAINVAEYYCNYMNLFRKNSILKDAIISTTNQRYCVELVEVYKQLEDLEKFMKDNITDLYAGSKFVDSLLIRLKELHKEIEAKEKLINDYKNNLEVEPTIDEINNYKFDTEVEELC